MGVGKIGCRAAGECSPAPVPIFRRVPYHAFQSAFKAPSLNRALKKRSAILASSSPTLPWLGSVSSFTLPPEPGVRGQDGVTVGRGAARSQTASSKICTDVVDPVAPPDGMGMAGCAVCRLDRIAWPAMIYYGRSVERSQGK